MEKRLVKKQFEAGEKFKITPEELIKHIVPSSSISAQRISDIKEILNLTEFLGTILREMSPDLYKIEIPVSDRQVNQFTIVFGDRITRSIANNRFIFLVHSISITKDGTNTVKRKEYVKALYKDIVYKVERTIICNKTYYKLFTTDTNEVVDTVFKRDRNLKLIN